MFRVTAGGVKLSEEFVNKMKSDPNKGVLLLEGRATTQNPLILEIRLDGKVVTEARLPMSIDGVEKMYRTVNLRAMQPVSSIPPPPNNPEDLEKKGDLIFIHGYQPAKESGPSVQPWHQAWMAEMFKRFYWSGSQARFHGVVWRSDRGDMMDYQKNVTNAFSTAPLLADYASTLAGPVTVVAHSLGNMVASSAIADHNMNIQKYVMCNAAVPSEAYDVEAPLDPRLVMDWWDDYDEKTWSANWYKFFKGSGDGREHLTWRGRFRDVAAKAEVWNFYSSGDEVFDLIQSPGLFTGILGIKVEWWYIIPVRITVNANGGRHSWQKQELFKGTKYSNGWASFGGTREAGWGFESRASTSDDPFNGMDQYDLVPIYTNAQAANALDAESLRNRPVFRNVPDWLTDGSALGQDRINFMLGMGIPALTSSIGALSVRNQIIPLLKQFDLDGELGSESLFMPNGWPSSGHLGQDEERWLHNDLKDVGFYFSYRLYDGVIGRRD